MTGTTGDRAGGLAVDVVINNYNYGRFLTAAIDSALAQVHEPVRVIVVDDGSSDDSPQIIRGYGDRILPVLKRNGGQASALNAGFAESEGEAVIFLDADDVLLPDIARRVAAALAAAPTACKVQYPLAVIDERGMATGSRKPHAHLPLPAGDLRRHAVTFPFDLPWLPTSGNAFSARLVRRLFPIPEEEFRLGSDWYLQHLTPLLGDVIALDAVGACYRVHGENRYERAGATLDLEQLRETIRLAAVTAAHLTRLADELGIPRAAGSIRSVADLGNRLISLRLDPDRHPLPEDGLLGLLADGVRAASRRFDVRWPMKALFVAWFTAMAAAPRPLAKPLAELFVFPERRRALNAVLARLHAAPPEGDGAP